MQPAARPEVFSQPIDPSKSTIHPQNDPELSGDKLHPVRERLRALAHKQEKLSRSRESLLLERSKVAANARAVRKQRTATADAEVVFMNRLREFFETHSDVFPQGLIINYEKVVQERDALGSLEEEYWQDERLLSGSEWTVMEMERNFYQYDLQDVFAEEDENPPRHDLLSALKAEQPIVPPPPTLFGGVSSATKGMLWSPPPPPPPPPPPFVLSGALLPVHGSFPPPPPPPPPLPQVPPPPPPPDTQMLLENIKKQYRERSSERDSLRREFNLLRSGRCHLLEVDPPGQGSAEVTRKVHEYEELDDTPSDLLDKIAACDVKLQHLRQESMKYEHVASRRKSEPAQMDHQSTSPFVSTTKAHTDGMLPTIMDNPNMKPRIREWILDCMKNNSVERTMYLNILQAVGIPVSDSHCFEDREEQYWPAESPDSSLQTPNVLESPTEREPVAIVSPPQYPKSSQKEQSTSHSTMPATANTQFGEITVAKDDIPPEDPSPTVETSGPFNERRNLGGPAMVPIVHAVALQNPSPHSNRQAPTTFGPNLTHSARNPDQESSQDSHHGGILDLETPLQPLSSSSSSSPTVPSTNDTRAPIPRAGKRTSGRFNFVAIWRTKVQPVIHPRQSRCDSPIFSSSSPHRYRESIVEGDGRISKVSTVPLHSSGRKFMVRTTRSAISYLDPSRHEFSTHQGDSELYDIEISWPF